MRALAYVSTPELRFWFVLVAVAVAVVVGVAVVTGYSPGSRAGETSPLPRVPMRR